jgi:hypothetical protein
MHMAVELCEQGDFDSVAEAFRWLMQEREAVDTIENLRDSLNEVADKWAREKIKAEDYARENMMLKANNGSRWFELFGTPERAARTIIKTCDETTECEACPIFHADINALNINCSDYDALLEWLRGDA